LEYLVLTILFLFGAGTNVYLVRQYKLPAKDVWLKYFVYLFYVALMLFILQFDRGYGVMVFFLIITYLAILDVLKASKGMVLIKLLAILLILYATFMLYISSWQSYLVFVTVVIFDGSAQLFGQLFGKRKLIPKISPNKTVEGLCLSVLISVICFLFMYQKLALNALAWGVFISAMIGAFCGDIAASWYKRKAGIKDYGNYIPGHGGMLDRVDSLLGAILFASLFELIYYYV
jgi:phosphatidate cytidylyltransferase